MRVLKEFKPFYAAIFLFYLQRTLVYTTAYKKAYTKEPFLVLIRTIRPLQMHTGRPFFELDENQI